MNEKRIREIANQASDHAENTVEYFNGHRDGLNYSSTLMKVRDLKFTELIVRECMAVGFAAVATVEDGCYAVDVYDRIKEHFGVE